MVTKSGHRAYAACAAILLLAAHTTTLHAQSRNITHKGENRRFIVYTPKGYELTSDRRYPVILNFHGGGMTMAEQMLYTGMNSAADRNGFIVVYPQGLGQDWNVGFETSYTDGTDDVGFIEVVLDQVVKDLRVDERRIYATGLSRGGFFTHRLAAELPHRIAAVAAVGAPLPVPVQQQHVPRGPRYPVGVMLVHGTADRVVMFDGKPESYLSAQDSHAWWIERNGLNGATEMMELIDVDAQDGTSVTFLNIGGESLRTTLVTIRDGGHTWAGADPFNVGLRIGVTSRDIDLNEVIWRFLAGHQR
ncbi:MAG: alpha/beta hydrolase-fold protein [Chloroflexota bacterium]|nr:alpha/beta hydrolase-fold protein [Chloroflexota bacterium]